MRIVYAQQDPVAPSIFLAGPTPRSADVQSWRPEALKILEELRFPGTVFVPEGPKCGENYHEQIEWEERCLKQATVIVFWIPRELMTMPGFTTNIEWGAWHKSGKVVLGAPADAKKMGYIRYYANRLGIMISTDLRGTLENALTLIKVLEENATN